MIGTLLGNRYELLEKIGEGGMAVVYKAKCHLLNRYVAVKILKEEFAKDMQFVDKFKREATAAASISDNNIVNIYDVGSQEGINYIVMEYVNGKTLKDVIRDKRTLNTYEAIEFATKIAKALECAHRNNIIHRDIKPHNILVTDDGNVKVTDFGIAKATNSVTITNTSKVMGSAHYFSPEQAKGSFVDCRTDIYSLGIVMYEMVTGKVPYDGESPVSVALKHIQEPVVPPRNINPSVPVNLNNVILKAIEKEPVKRYQTVKELLLDLNKLQQNQDFNVRFSDLDDDRTRVMDAVKVEDYVNNTTKASKANIDDLDDEEDGFYDYEDSKDSGRESRKGLDKKKKNMILIVTAVIFILVVGFASGYVIYNKFINPQQGAASKKVIIPNIIGLTKDQAQKLLEDKNLKLEVSSTEKSDKPEGTILSCNPEVGSTVKSNETIKVVISEGLGKTLVPNLRELDLEVAKDILNKNNLKLGDVKEAYDDNVPKNCVISQSPSKDEQVDVNSNVDLVISKGPEIKYSTVPSLNGKTIEEARNILAGANLNLGDQKTVETSDKSLNGKIFEQSLEAYSKVSEGSYVNVTYYVYKKENPEKPPTDGEDESGEGNNTEDGGNNNEGNDNNNGNSNSGSKNK
ncbi:Stk1 family PASTA domain-containing Ser/Thr kinase [Clostridium rectalis]|uniref:Stk1 family PASTA domain-containing Ser/Thr kinase n=1 Tax=Clostridium rectalis TaxID=2040295 RepID=UPI000F639A0E|nr:Stk1 family PASTA domain-containing Ser/Thr kinase [Clostridium rectalis]